MKSVSVKTCRANYEPLKGFFDLRDFIMPDSVFVKFYKIQLFLYSCEEARKKGLYKHDKAKLDRIKELSAQYQQALFLYPEKL